MDTSILVSSQRNFSARDITPSFCIGDRVQVEYTTEPPGFKHFIDDLKNSRKSIRSNFFLKNDAYYRSMVGKISAEGFKN